MSENQGAGQPDVTIESLRAEVVDLKERVVPQLRDAEAARDVAAGRVAELETAMVSLAGERDAALASANAAVASASAARVEAEALKAAVRVPAGFGGRVGADTSGMSASQKIAHGLQAQSGGR